LDRHKLKWNGWGLADKTFELGERADALWKFLADELAMDSLDHVPPRALEAHAPSPSALAESIAAELAAVVGAEHVKRDPYERVFHSAGRSFRDVVALRIGPLPSVTDAVVYPRNTSEVERILAIATEHGIGVVPFGGGSSVVGGVEPRRGRDQSSVLTLDTSRMNDLVSIDDTSQTATLQAGIYGPELERKLGERGYVLGHAPQSFEFSTLGGWVAARGAGQQSNGYGVAAALLAGATVATPSGLLRTGVFPNSSTGPDLKQVIAGSEGAFGVITEATMRIRSAPERRDYRGYLFRSWDAGVEAVRDIVQQGVPIATLRLSDPDETYFFGTFSSLGKTRSGARRVAEQVLSQRGYGRGGVFLLVGIEGAIAKVVGAVARSTTICVGHGAIPIGTGAGKRWYQGRFEMPYLRDPLLDRGVAVDTLETATTWSNLGRLYQGVREALHGALDSMDRKGLVLAHVSHGYATGASLYFTFVYPLDRTDPLAQWIRLKRAASDAISECAGTISHHHGVGTDHMEWLVTEKGELGMRLVRAMKTSVDPRGVMNPGKLVL
jgi:alkyldihydroxyacetonephosphate synthase